MQVDARRTTGAGGEAGIGHICIDRAGAATELDASAVAIGVHQATNAAVNAQQRQGQGAAVEISHAEIHQGAAHTRVHSSRTGGQARDRGRIIHRRHVDRYIHRGGGGQSAVIDRFDLEGRRDGAAIEVGERRPHRAEVGVNQLVAARPGAAADQQRSFAAINRRHLKVRDGAVAIGPIACR